MTVSDFRPPSDEPAVRHEGLRVLVDAARAEPAPALHVDAQAIYAGWQQRRTGQRRGLAVGLVLAATVLLGVGVLELRGAIDRESEAEGPVAVDGGSTPAARPTDAEGTRAALAPDPTLEGIAPREPVPPALPVLAATIHVSPLAPGRAAPEVLGARALRLPEGSWSIDSEEAEPVEIALPDGTLELRGGSVQVRIAGDVAHVEVLRDEVLRVDATGQRITLRPRPARGVAEPAGPTVASPSPAELAREAEELMAAGDRAGAIRALRRLVTRHGRSAAAQAGLIDLGRLLKASGQPDEARCAYGLFLARWPGHALAGDVTRAREALGKGPSCDALRPRK